MSDFIFPSVFSCNLILHSSFMPRVVLFHSVALAYPEAWKIWQEEETSCERSMSSGAVGASCRKNPQSQDVLMCRINDREQ